MLAICHTSYSLQTGVRSPQDWVKAAANRGYSALAVSDVNGLYGAVHFAKAAGAAGVKPIIGATLSCEPDQTCTVLARSQEGYRQLCRLLSARHLQTPFRPDAALEAAGADGLLFLTHSALLLREFAKVVPKENIYALPGTPPISAGASPLFEPASSSAPLAAIPDAWFLDESDRETFALLRGLRRLAGPDFVPNAERNPGALLPSAAVWQSLFPDPYAAREIEERCEFKFEFGRPLFPKIAVPAGETPASHLCQICRQALLRRYTGTRAAAATARLEHELAAICDTGFADYFLYISEIVAFARNAGIPAEVRGSAASSVVSYLLGFTHCCPLEHDLYFERFLNPGRRDCPDIDLDIADNRRAEVIAFCYRRWGTEHVAMVATVNTYRLAGALWDAARLAGLPPERYRELLRRAWGDIRRESPARVEFVGNQIARQLQVPVAGDGTAGPRLISENDLDILAAGENLSCEERIQGGNPRPGGAMIEGPAPGTVPAFAELLRLARRLVGLPRHLGIHCGGLLITPCPLTDVTPLVRSPKGLIVSQFEKEQAAAVGLVKMDLLGNSALSVIREATDLLARDGTSLTEPGPIFDFKVRRLFGSGDTLGIYQCESPGMRQLCCAVKPNNPQETAAALSLIRPGPSAAGMKERFIRRRLGLEPVTYLHPKMATVLGATYGVMLYQEDVMRLAVNLAGYTPADADGLRRAVSKTRYSLALEREHDRFVFERAADAGITRDDANAIWQLVRQFAAYSYCKAHAAVYGRLAWLTARLKAHYPREFYTAILNSHKSMYPPRVFVWDAIRHGIPILAPDVQYSEEKWVPVRNGIRCGLGLIRGLRETTLHRLLAERRREPFRCFAEFRRRVPFQAGELERLVLAGACRAFGSREKLLAELIASGRYEGQLSLLTPVLKDLPPLLQSELWLTGIPFCSHPVERKNSGTCMAAELGRFVGREVEMVGILDTWKPLRAQNQERTAERDMAFVTLEDASGLFELVLFPDVFARLRRLFFRIGPYRVRGRVVHKWGAVMIEVGAAEPWQPVGLRPPQVKTPVFRQAAPAKPH